ncbi:cytotoxic translational repressor of toxin-antitoxin stability system [bacterium]|nr:cytotoxic translational repressor of toxin-antitoxin stability system [bacterium]
MSWSVTIKKKVVKSLKKLPKNVQEDLMALLVDLEDSGPIRGDWPNYSKLADGSHHCHLNYSYVAVWIVENKQLKVIEVTYVGSRENAPY